MDARLIGRVIDTVRTVNPLLAVSASALDLHQPPASGSVRAQVAARLADGTFRVLIDGKALKLSLPADIKPGDVLQLRVVGRDAAAAAPVTTDSSTYHSGNRVSSAGQLVADLVKQLPAAPARQSQPVLDSPPDSPVDLPEPLARAVERSGLFFESHQARWVSGDFPLERLLQEPQASAGKQGEEPRFIASTEPNMTESDAPPAVKSTLAVVVDDDISEATDLKQSSATQDARAAESKLANKADEIVTRETLNIVRQQLETLETRHIQWLGEIWPGQPMRWEIGQDPDDQSAARDTDHDWDSRFTLDLPALGNVGAELVLSGRQLRVRMSAQDAQTAAMMRDTAQELVSALQAAGIEPATLEVQHREPSF